jgi:dTDP-4-dehydrorhamnose reductase
MSDTLLITGASGQLGAYVLRAAVRDRSPVVAWGGPGTFAPRREVSLVAAAGSAVPLLPLDLTSNDQLTSVFRSTRPRWILHLAAVSRVEACHRDPHRAWRINVDATRRLVELAAESQADLLLASTDMVFDGCRGDYGEGDRAEPLMEYARTKRAAEDLVLAYDRGIVVRLSLLYGPSRNGRRNFFDRQCDQLGAGKPIRLFADEWRTPLGLHVAAGCLPLVARSGYRGVLHLGGTERMSRWEMGRRLARWLGRDPALVEADQAAQRDLAEPRPQDVSLDSRRIYTEFPGLPRPGFEESLHELLSEGNPM